MKDVVDGMNREMKCADARRKVLKLCVAWQGVDFSAPHRIFIREGDLTKTDRKGFDARSFQFTSSGLFTLHVFIDILGIVFCFSTI